MSIHITTTRIDVASAERLVGLIVALQQTPDWSATSPSSESGYTAHAEAMAAFVGFLAQAPATFSSRSTQGLARLLEDRYPLVNVLTECIGFLEYVSSANRTHATAAAL